MGAMSPLRINVVCSGNICRSPMGEKVFARALSDAGLADRVQVSSSGTGDWHIGDGADGRARALLREAGYPEDHAGSQITKQRIGEFDLYLAAEDEHVEHLKRLGADPDSIVLIRSLDPTADSDQLPDPYYTSDERYREVFEMIQAAAPGVVESVRERLGR